MTLKHIELWHQTARPKPDEKAFNVQLGCHLEEIQEMLATLDSDSADTIWLLNQLDVHLTELATRLKKGRATVKIINGMDFLDSLADQVVTAVGTGHCAEMDVPEACVRVDVSNWSKFNADGTPFFDGSGKIAKNPLLYTPPDLTGLY